MYTISETKPKFSAPLIIILIVGIINILNQNFIVGSLIVVLCIGFIFLLTGIKFNNENQTFKRYSVFLGVPFGKWKAMPDIKYISLLRVKQSRKSYSPSSRMYVQRASKNCKYQVNFIINGKRHPYKLLSTSAEKAIKTGLELGDYLNLKVFDSTSPDRKWIR